MITEITEEELNLQQQILDAQRKLLKLRNRSEGVESVSAIKKKQPAKSPPIKQPEMRIDPSSQSEFSFSKNYIESKDLFLHLSEKFDLKYSKNNYRRLMDKLANHFKWATEYRGGKGSRRKFYHVTLSEVEECYKKFSNTPLGSVRKSPNKGIIKTIKIDNYLSMGEVCDALVLSKGSTPSAHACLKVYQNLYNIPDHIFVKIYNNVKYYKADPKKLWHCYCDIEVKRGNPRPSKFIPNGFVDRRTICSWGKVSYSSNAPKEFINNIEKYFGKKLEKVFYKRCNYYNISRKEVEEVKVHLDNEIEKARSSNCRNNLGLPNRAMKPIHELKQQGYLSANDIRKTLKIGNLLLHRFVEWCNFSEDDVKVITNMNDSSKVRAVMYKISEEEMFRKFNIFSEESERGNHPKPSSTLSPFSTNFQWYLKDGTHKKGLVLEKSQFNILDNIDENCSIEFVDQGHPIEITLNILRQDCIDAIINQVN